MRIAHVSATFPPYEAGTGRVCYYNAVELARRGNDVTVFTAEASLGHYVDPPEIKVIRLPKLIQIGNAPLMLDLLKLNDFDIIHLHFPQILTPELIWLVSQFRKIPYVLTHHNDLIADDYRRFFFTFYYPFTKHISARGARRFIAVSMDHAKNCGLTPIFKNRWQDVKEVPNGVDVKLFRPNIAGAKIREKLHLQPDQQVIAFVGALDRAHHFKGVDRIFRALTKIGSDSIHLLVIGDGDLRPQYENLVANLGIANQVHFIGKVPHDQLAPYYIDANILILASSPPESFGMVLVEAGACQRSVIASNIPGVRSVVIDGETGFLIPDGDIDALASKIKLLLDNPALREQMGLAGYKRIKENYTWAMIAKQLEGIYHDVIEDRNVNSRASGRL